MNNDRIPGRITGQIKTVLLLGALTAFVVGAGSFAAPSYAWLFAIIGVAMNLGSWFFSDRLVLRSSGARPLGPDEAPELHQMVDELSRAAGIPAPKLYLVEEHYANAFATGRNPANGAVAVTAGLLRVLPRREVRGVIAHEIAHIRNRDITIATVAAGLAAVISGIANAVQFSALFGGGSSSDEDGPGSTIGALLFAMVAPIGAMLVQMAISRSREYVADATAARLTGDPEALASALERLSRAAEHIPAQVQPATASLYIVNPLAGGLAALFSTHPPMEARIARLRGTASGPA